MTDARPVAGDEAEAVLAAFSETQAVIRFTPDGRILSANSAFLRTMDATDIAELKGQHHRIFLWPDDQDSDAYQRFWKDIAGGRFQQGEFCRRTLKGRRIWISATYTPVPGPDGRVREVVKFALDVTERRVAVDRLKNALIRLAAGDITVRLDDTVRGQFEGLRETFNQTAADLEELIRSVMGSSERLAWSGEAMQENAEGLAKKTDEQAEALKRTSASLGKVAARTRATSEAASEADARAKAAQASARKGEEIVTETIEAIQRIEDVTREVSKITKVIEGFAFQTNLLSINAAVEAARAGEAGKGFAVVASEVRSLAQRSAEASKSIGDLTRRCETDVANGAALAASAGKALDEIGTSVGTVVSSVDEIASASKEQAAGLSEIERSLGTVEDAIKTLSGLSGDGASNANKLSTELLALHEIIEHFSTRSNRSGGVELPKGLGSDRRLRAEDHREREASSVRATYSHS